MTPSQPSGVPSIQILMSTYNGERYLESQLDSLLKQTYEPVRILIRDDGSQDGTVQIINRYLEMHNNIQLIRGENLGVVPAFFELIRLADDTSTYFAFCDQDDIWEPHRVERGISLLARLPADVPTLLASATTLIDADNQLLGTSSVPRKPLGLQHALVQNTLIGNTMLFNMSARKLVLSCQPELRNIAMHDWWVYLITGAFGTVIFECEPLVRYRQHGLNVVGTRSTSLASRLRRFQTNQRKCTIQADEFRRCYYDRLNTRQQYIIDRFLDQRLNLLQRLWYSLTRDVYRQDPMDDFLLSWLIILNRV